MKDKMTALILSIFVGTLGVDRFYLGYTGMVVLKLMTGGCFGVLYIIDIIHIATGKLGPADGSDFVDNASPLVTTQPTSAENSVFTELEKASELYKSGALTEGEYAEIKTSLLTRI